MSIMDNIRRATAEVDFGIGRITGTAGGRNREHIELLAAWSAYARTMGFCMSDACRNTVIEIDSDQLYCDKCKQNQREQGASMNKDFRIEVHCPHCQWIIYDTSIEWFSLLSKCPGCKYPLMEGIIS